MPQRTVAPFVPGSLTASNQAIGNIYDGRYNRSRLIKPAHAAQDIFVPCAGEEAESKHAWFPISKDQSFSRAPGCVQYAHEETALRAALGLDRDDRTQWIPLGTMESPMGWKSSACAAYLYDQMS